MFDELKTAFHTAAPSIPAFLFAVETPSKSSVLLTIILPILFFSVSKTVDVLMQFHFRRQEAARLEREHRERLAAISKSKS